MFQKADEQYLLGKLGMNEVVLFLGAGFSSEAKNIDGMQIPIGDQFSKMLWNFLGYDGDYDYTPLNTMFEAFIESPKKLDDKKHLINQTFTISDFPDSYLSIAKIPWFKIYTI
ncbi:MAG: hypothetical protein IT258_24260, partial [Saprospiraceae bacterium]|nr:hypothetical protein [Saprospiraceae bacterium]